jgi:hypothetical protein
VTHGRHSGIGPAELEAARDGGVVRLLSHGPETGYSVAGCCMSGGYDPALGHVRGGDSREIDA